MNKPLRNSLISIFVVVWLCVFHYASLRAFYLEPLMQRPLPGMKFLFPPAGWIMFYRVGDYSGEIEVFGLKTGKAPQFIDPHQIFQTRQIGYDNIHRGAMSVFAEQRVQPQACRFLRRKFPYFDQFLVTYVEHPSPSKNVFEMNRYVVYECEGER